MKISEAYTSKLCYRCGTKGIRRNGLFKCSNCELKENSDRNAALNIGKRALEHVSRIGAQLVVPRTRAGTIKTSCRDAVSDSGILHL